MRVTPNKKLTNTNAILTLVFEVVSWFMIGYLEINIKWLSKSR